ncbi:MULTISPECIES: hypothetical protein [Desulfosediminicola]|uniref:hypothetical protein n=1 Tax=Desulfosediminicola TaxID=2886823 RepID=UPI0010AB817C|nr:hypothetical protein [Desulfosediminicola ganghwensis]
MKKLSSKGQKWLKCLHIYSGTVWVGCATTLAIMQFFVNPSTGPELYGIVATLDFIDLFILVPGAIGTFVTALVYSIWTHWGWFKHNWITVKWIICIFGLVFGTFALGPWTSEMAVIAKERGLDALADTQYLSNKQNSMIFGTIQALTVIFAVFISTLKPWKKKGITQN